MFKNMKLGTKLQSIFLIVSIMGFIVAAFGIFNMSRMHERTEFIYKRELMGLSYIKEANINLIYIGRARSNYMLATSEEDRNRFKALIEESTINLKDNVSKARALFISKEAKDLFAKYDIVYPTYNNNVQTLVQLTGDDKFQEQTEQVKKLVVQSRENSTTLDNLFSDLSKLKEERAKDEFQETSDFYENSRFIMILLVVSSTSLGIVFGILMTRAVTHKLGGEPEYAASIAKKIAEGDLTVQVNTHPKDNSSLLFAMKEMQANLSTIVYQVKVGAETIKVATDEIAKGNMDLSYRTEEQASSLEETASSMEEITSTVQHNSSNTNEASKLAKNVAESATVSSKEVANVLSTMTTIQDSSKEMVEIISVVEGIAFQTNILALNAAVEAARAGEQGRGFAVVAGEVRNLAQRSSTAAKEIRDLINKSVDQISVGANQAANAGIGMNGIVDKINKVSQIIHDINIAGQEQNASIGQINDAIMQMDNVTQQNAALVEEAAAASQSLQDQSVNLSNLVSIFKFENKTTSSTTVKIETEKSKPLTKKNVLKLEVNQRALPIKNLSKQPVIAPEWEEF